MVKKTAKRKSSNVSASTEKKLRNLKPFKSGEEWTGNAKGRPKGSRNKLCAKYIEDLQEIWLRASTEKVDEAKLTMGQAALLAVAQGRPTAFVTAVGNLVPKEFDLGENSQAGFKALWELLASGKVPQPTETEDDA